MLNKKEIYKHWKSIIYAMSSVIPDLYISDISEMNRKNLPSFVVDAMCRSEHPLPADECAATVVIPATVIVLL